MCTGVKKQNKRTLLIFRLCALAKTIPFVCKNAVTEQLDAEFEDATKTANEYNLGIKDSEGSNVVEEEIYVFRIWLRNFEKKYLRGLIMICMHPAFRKPTFKSSSNLI